LPQAGEQYCWRPVLLAAGAAEIGVRAVAAGGGAAAEARATLKRGSGFVRAVLVIAVVAMAMRLGSLSLWPPS
jgi:hypothetical protein